MCFFWLSRTNPDSSSFGRSRPRRLHTKNIFPSELTRWQAADTKLNPMNLAITLNTKEDRKAKEEDVVKPVEGSNRLQEPREQPVKKHSAEEQAALSFQDDDSAIMSGALSLPTNPGRSSIDYPTVIRAEYSRSLIDYPSIEERPQEPKTSIYTEEVSLGRVLAGVVEGGNFRFRFRVAGEEEDIVVPFEVKVVANTKKAPKKSKSWCHFFRKARTKKGKERAKHEFYNL